MAAERLCVIYMCPCVLSVLMDWFSNRQGQGLTHGICTDWFWSLEYEIGRRGNFLEHFIQDAISHKDSAVCTLWILFLLNSLLIFTPEPKIGKWILKRLDPIGLSVVRIFAMFCWSPVFFGICTKISNFCNGFTSKQHCRSTQSVHQCIMQFYVQLILCCCYCAALDTHKSFPAMCQCRLNPTCSFLSFFTISPNNINQSVAFSVSG